MKVQNRLTNITLAIAILSLVAQVAVAFEVREAASGPPGLSGKPMGQMAKTSTALRKAMMEFDAHVQQGKPEDTFAPSNRFLQVSRGRITIDAVATGNVGTLLKDLQALGLQNESQYGNFISGTVPLRAIPRLIALDSLRRVSAVWQPLTNAGMVTSQGVQRLRANVVQAGDPNANPPIPPYTGSGVMVGVLSDSYDHLGGAALDQANDDLPANVTVLDDSGNCGSTLLPAPCTDEGRAMMQLVHDVAPGADLAFHTAFGGIAGFALGIQELAGCPSGSEPNCMPSSSPADIIVDDVIYFAEPWFQDGIIAQAINQVVGHGVAYFSAAGNFVDKSYQSPFEHSNERLIVQTGILCPWICQTEDRGELHDFGSGDWTQRITIPPGRTVIIALQWDQPYGASLSDYDIYLLDPQSSVVVSKSIDNNRIDDNGTGDPFEVLVYENTGDAPVSFDLIITHFAGPVAGTMKYIMYGAVGFGDGGDPVYVTEEYSTHSSTLSGHANAAGAEAVGAAFYQQTPAHAGDSDALLYADPPVLEFFSSKGGTPILFDENGVRLTDSVDRDKPEIVATDGTHTTFFGHDDNNSGPGPWDDDGPEPNFFGTSAAAPHAAAVAALMREADPSLAAEAIYTALESTAIPMQGQDEENFDNLRGYGFIQADAAIAFNVAFPVAQFSGTPTSGNMPLMVTFNDQSTNAPTSWSWTFGDGGTSTQQNPSYTYTTAGTYAVSLTATNAGGSDSLTKTAYITVSNPPPDAPVAQFSGTPTSGNMPLMVTFNDQSTNAPTSWSWTFGDGGTSTQQNPSYTYTTAGTYAVSLTATNAGGSDSLTKTAYITVSNPPAMDVVTIDKAQYRSRRNLLEVLAASTDATAVLTAYNAGTGALLGQLVNGRLRMKVNPSPTSVQVDSNKGGSDTKAVQIR